MGIAVGVIPARRGSQRLAGKNVLMVAGRPLIEYTIQAALASRQLGVVVVSTDDPAVDAVARRCGARVIQRPGELAQADSPIDDALRHAAQELQKEGLDIDIVVCMQANVPVRRPGEIDDVVARLRRWPQASAVATGYRVSQRPEWMKRIVDEATGEVSGYMDAGRRYRMQDLESLYLFDGATIAIRIAPLNAGAGDRRLHAYMGNRVLIYEHPLEFAVEVDEAEDLPIAEFYLQRQAAALGEQRHNV